MCENNKMKSVLFCGLFLWSLIFVAVSTQEETPLDYQDDCNPTSDTTDFCDKKKHLKCKGTATSGYCDCDVKPVEGGAPGETVDLFYMFEKSTCVSPPKGPCRDRFFDGNYVLECSRNAYCIQSNYTIPGLCDCYDNYVPQDFSGHCIVSHGGPCNTVQDCDIYAHLTCSADTCSCEQKSVWDVSACKGLVGGTCEVGGQRPKYCVEHAECVNSSSICGCAAGYQESTSDNRCYKKFGQDCTVPTDETTPRECHENFECITRNEEGTDTTLCRCSENYDVSEPDQTKCLGRSGATCDKANPERSFCTPFATCTNTTENPEDPHICQCDEGYSAASDKMCRAKHGTVCVVPTNNTTPSPSDSQCNTDLKLECVKVGEEPPACQCIQNHMYDDSRGVCLGYAGASCGAGTECVSNYCDNGTCGCPAGSTASTDGTKCYYPYGTSCTNENDAVCNPLTLKCGDNGTCTCLNDELVREGSKEGCSVKAGQSCSEGSGRECVGQSTCMDDGSGNKVCQCDAGYAGRFDGLCAVRGSAGKVAGSFLSVALVLFFTFLQ